jgi:MerR family transcriptional regulator, copper efflux regulator
LTPYWGTDLTLVTVGDLTISQLAQEAGVNIETIRYYERRRLLREPPRTRSGYRQYSDSDLWRLQFIARAKQLGFTLAEIATLMGPVTDGSADGGGSQDSVVAMARAKMEPLDVRQEELAETRSRLERLIDICGDPASDDCRALRITD